MDPLGSRTILWPACLCTTWCAAHGRLRDSGSSSSLASTLPVNAFAGYPSNRTCNGIVPVFDPAHLELAVGLVDRPGTLWPSGWCVQYQRGVWRDKTPLRVTVYSARPSNSQGTFEGFADFAGATRAPTYEHSMYAVPQGEQRSRILHGRRSAHTEKSDKVGCQGGGSHTDARTRLSRRANTAGKRRCSTTTGMQQRQTPAVCLHSWTDPIQGNHSDFPARDTHSATRSASKQADAQIE